MRRYIYIPVNTAEMRTFGMTITNYMSKTYGGVASLLSNPFEMGWRKGAARLFGGCLKGLGDSDILYVVCHGNGNPGSRRIGANRSDGNMKSYTAEELAANLESEGLPKGFKNLHMMTCGSGLMNKSVLQGQYSGNPRIVRDPHLDSRLTAQNSIARQVCDAMKARGYVGIEVTGYLGDISTNPPDSVSIDIGGSPYRSASDPQFVGLDWCVVCR